MAAGLIQRSQYPASSSSSRPEIDRQSGSLAEKRDGVVHVSELQRSRLLAAAVGAVEEFGYAGASVAHITGRARISRRTFYELFDNREECLVAVLDSTVAQITAEVEAAHLADLDWRERVRGGLWAILSFFDRERTLARVCIVASQGAGIAVLGRRQEILDGLAQIVDQGGGEDPPAGAKGLTAQGVVGAVFSIVYSRLLNMDSEPLTSLLGELMAMIVLPYKGQAVARRERDRPLPETTPRAAGANGRLTSALGSTQSLVALPMRLTYRTALVLSALAEHPEQSNRQVAELVGISDQGQISKLLQRLRRLGLVENAAEGAHDKGQANQWVLTPTGVTITRSIQAHHNSTTSACETSSEPSITPTSRATDAQGNKKVRVRGDK